jgi:hypothetical protein
MTAEGMGRWVKFFSGTFYLPPAARFLKGIAVVTGAVLLVLGIRWFLLAPREAELDLMPKDTVVLRANDSVRLESEPFSVLFGLDKHEQIPFVLLSTVIGPNPRAVVQAGNKTIHVSPGDTIQGAVVDSVGRGVILVRLKGRRIRVTL